MAKPITLSDFETFKETGSRVPKKPKEKITTEQEDLRIATSDDLKRTLKTLEFLIQRYHLKRFAIMRQIGHGSCQHHDYFNGQKPVPYSVLEQLSKLFMCDSVGDFFMLPEAKKMPNGLRARLLELNLIL